MTWRVGGWQIRSHPWLLGMQATSRAAALGSRLRGNDTEVGAFWLVVLVFLAGCVAAGGAFAQRTTATQPAPVPEASHSQTVTLPAGTGMLLRLPQPAATVMSADPGVA